MAEKVKIAFFLVSTDSGGSETYLLRFLTAFQEQIDSVIFCKSGSEGKLSDNFRKIGVDVRKLKIAYVPFLDFYKCCKELRRLKPDVVCDFTGDLSCFVMLSARLLGIKERVVQYRNSAIPFKMTFLRSIYWKCVHWLTTKCATRFVSNSKAAFDFYFPDRNRLSQEFNVVYNGVKQEKVNVPEMRKKIRAKYNIPETAFVVGHTGNFRPEKNHSVLMSIAEKLCKQDRNIYFLCCGRDVNENYGGLLAEKRLSSRVVCPGSVTNVWEHLCAMDAFCFPSISEGQSNALIEAMLLNLPFVASDIPANRETVPTELLSELVEPLNVDGFCEKILKIKSDSNYCTNLKRVQWALERYEPHKRFEEMFQALVVRDVR